MRLLRIFLRNFWSGFFWALPVGFVIGALLAAFDVWHVI